MTESTPPVTKSSKPVNPRKTGGRRRKDAAPLVAVDLPVANVRKNLSLKEPTARLLADYAAFLSEHHGKAVEEDLVVEGLIETLRRDRLFSTWNGKRTQGRESA